MIVISDVREPVAIMISETSSSEGSAIISDDAYTFTDTTEGFYTPWGTSAIDGGLSYFKPGYWCGWVRSFVPVYSPVCGRPCNKAV